MRIRYDMRDGGKAATITGWRGGRVDECGGFEGRLASHTWRRGFESSPLRRLVACAGARVHGGSTYFSPLRWFVDHGGSRRSSGSTDPRRGIMRAKTHRAPPL